MNPHMSVRWFVGWSDGWLGDGWLLGFLVPWFLGFLVPWSVGLSVINFEKRSELHFHAPIGALILS